MMLGPIRVNNFEFLLNFDLLREFFNMKKTLKKSLLFTDDRERLRPVANDHCERLVSRTLVSGTFRQVCERSFLEDLTVFGSIYLLLIFWKFISFIEVYCHFLTFLSIFIKKQKWFQKRFHFSTASYFLKVFFYAKLALTERQHITYLNINVSLL